MLMGLAIIGSAFLSAGNVLGAAEKAQRQLGEVNQVYCKRAIF
jgi:hypothetical protein